MKVVPIEVEYIDHCGNDNSVVRAARVSFANDAEKFDDVKDAKLIQYLAKHKHKSPFNHTFITVKVKAPLYVSRQLVKHKFMPWNEESRRYIDSDPEFYFPDTYRKTVSNVKQGSSEVETVPFSMIDIDNQQFDEKDLAVACLQMYRQKLEDGCCNEQAREVLPQSMMVNWYWSGTLGAFADMLILRLDSHTQKETRIVAEQIRDIIMPLFPVSLSALLENP
jgi:thymidylate synthase (FAD)